LLKAALHSGTAANEAWQQWTGAASADGGGHRDDAKDAWRLLPLVAKNLGAQASAGESLSKARSAYDATKIRNHLLEAVALSVAGHLHDQGIDVIL
jgi:hypothetical protein